MKAWVLAMTLVIAGLLGVVNAPTAVADPAQPDGPPDGGDHVWCYLPSFHQEVAADAAMTRLRNQTVVTTSFPGACGDHTDVRWRQGDLNGSYGRAECQLRRTNGTCDVYNITLAMATIDAAARPIEQRTKTSCHELGHTVGVQHYSGNDFPGGDTAHSCLRSGEVTASWTNLTIYGQHHRTQHINPNFS